MALFDPNTQLSLADILGSQANTQVSGVQDTYAQKKKRLVAQQAHSGQLLSGNADYALSDLATGQAGDEAGVYSGLAGALGQVPAEDWGNTQDNARKRRLAELIGNLNKPSSLQEALSALGQGAQIAGGVAAFL